MIKICGLVAMLAGSYGFHQTSDLWFAQGFLIGLFFCISESIFEFVVNIQSEGLIEMVDSQNGKA